jgi:hypothetical protein
LLNCLITQLACHSRTFPNKITCSICKKKKKKKVDPQVGNHQMGFSDSSPHDPKILSRISGVRTSIVRRGAYKTPPPDNRKKVNKKKNTKKLSCHHKKPDTPDVPGNTLKITCQLSSQLQSSATNTHPSSIREEDSPLIPDGILRNREYRFI